MADLGGDDLGNAAAATKAVATGDPRYVEQVALEDDVKRLSAMVRAHSDAKAATPRSGARWSARTATPKPQRRGAALGGPGGHRLRGADG